MGMHFQGLSEEEKKQQPEKPKEQEIIIKK